MSGKYSTDYQIKKHTGRSSIYNRKGLYSEDRYVPELEIIMKNIRMQYWHLTAHFIIMDWPTPYRIIIMSQRPKVIRKIEDVRVKQIYENSNAFEMGKTTIEYDGVDL